MVKRLEANEALIFPNGVYIFKSNGVQIDPRSKEGLIIQNIYKEQEAVRKLNRDEKLKWIVATFPRDPVKQQEYRTRFGV